LFQSISPDTSKIGTVGYKNIFVILVTKSPKMSTNTRNKLLNVTKKKKSNKYFYKEIKKECAAFPKYI